MVYLKTSLPVDPLIVAVMREVDHLAKEVGVSYFVCGAMARDILLTHVHGIVTGLATVDIDFGVAVENWEQFDKIKTRLIETERFRPDDKAAHRLYYKSSGGKGYPIDIIPFGRIENPPNSIAWPTDIGIVMNVTGYVEALANVVQIQIEEDFIVPVISLPGQVLLKLFAWTDRGGQNSKDARDLATLLRTYCEAGNADRLYEDDRNILESADYDMIYAGCELLGKDVRGIAERQTLAHALVVMSNPTQTEQLTTHIAASLPFSADRVADAELLLARFKAGLSGA